MKDLWRGLVVLTFLVIITGVIYPLFITGVGHIVFPKKTTGSLIELQGRLVGSELIGQNFTSPRYFWGRPSATFPPYNPLTSQAADLGPSNPALVQNVAARIKMLQRDDPHQSIRVPIDLVTSSASGLDPHISLLSAEYQVPRVARARGIKEGVVEALIKQNTITPQFSFMGQARVNVLQLNLALDQLK